MTRLNDTQMLLLATAGKRDDGSLYPLPETRNGAAARAAKAITALMKLGLVVEREATDSSAVVRRDGDIGYGIFVTAAGLAAIGVVDDEGEAGVSGIIPPVTPPAAATSKRDAVIALLRAGQGATMPELIAATGWLPHTTRAALAGLRKQGHVIERDNATCYRIVGAA